MKARAHARRSARFSAFSTCGRCSRRRRTPGAGSSQRLFTNVRTVVVRQGHRLTRVRSPKALADADRAMTAIDQQAELELAQLFARHGLAAPKVQLHAHTAMSLIAARVSTDRWRWCRCSGSTSPRRKPRCSPPASASAFPHRVSSSPRAWGVGLSFGFRVRG
jgi:hypothetical protein